MHTQLPKLRSIPARRLGASLVLRHSLLHAQTASYLLKALGAVVIIVSLTGCRGRSIGSANDIERFDLWVSCYLSEERGIGSVRLIGQETTGFIAVDDVELTRAEIKRVLEGFVRTKHFRRRRDANRPLYFPGCSIYVRFGSLEYQNHLLLNEETIRKLKVLRGTLSGEAAEAFDGLLESVEAHRDEWGQGESRRSPE